MKSLTKTTILFLVALALTVALSGVYTFLFVAMKNKTTTTAELSAKNETLAGKESRVAASLSTIKEEKTSIEKFREYFIKESEVVAFTKKIELLGPESGTVLSLEALEPGIGIHSEPILNLRIVATGEFQNVIRLLGLLENFPAKFEWKNVDISLNDIPLGAKVPKAPQWKIVVSLSALNFLKE